MKVGDTGLIDGKAVVINQVHNDGRITVHNGQGTAFRTIPKERFTPV